MTHTPLRALGPPEHLAAAQLTVDLSAIQANYRLLSTMVAPGVCGAAVKGDAYGLGLGPVSRALWAAGCRHFFVARPSEGGDLRPLLPRDAVIYVLDGLFPGQAEFYATEDLRPALISHAEAREWAAFGRVWGRKLPCAIHFDSGINRLGFDRADLAGLVADNRTIGDLNIALVMSHLACGDDPASAMNQRQLSLFTEQLKALPQAPVSLANSGGIFLGQSWHFDIARPGIALYGGNPNRAAVNPMKPVVQLTAPILQLRSVAPGETVGYGATWTAERPSRIAILGAGYRDGIPRSLSSTRTDGPAQVAVAGRRAAVVGRVSMDMLGVDVTGIPEQLCGRGALVEVLGATITADEAAGWAGTIPYEILTRLGTRYARHYTGGGESSAS